MTVGFIHCPKCKEIMAYAHEDEAETWCGKCWIGKIEVENK